MSANPIETMSTVKPQSVTSERQRPTRVRLGELAPEQAFRECVAIRVGAALETIRRIGGAGRYPHTPEDEAKIFTALEKAVADARRVFNAFSDTKGRAVAPRFDLG